MTGLTPDITAVAVVEHGVLRLTFADGVIGGVPVLERMRGPVFAAAVTPEGFDKVTVDPETGTVVWPGGADLAPDTLYERIRRHGRVKAWPPEAQGAGLARGKDGKVWRSLGFARVRLTRRKLRNQAD